MRNEDMSVRVVRVGGLCNMSHDFNRWRSKSVGVSAEIYPPRPTGTPPKRGFFNLVMIPNLPMMNRRQRISLRHPPNIHSTIHNPMIVAFHPAHNLAFQVG